MTIGDLVLLLAVLGSSFTLAILCVWLVRRQWRWARATGLFLLSAILPTEPFSSVWLC